MGAGHARNAPSSNMLVAEQQLEGDVAESQREILEAQAKRLRATIARRRSVPGCNNNKDNVSAIVTHYEQVLADLEGRISRLSPIAQAAGDALTPSASATSAESAPSPSTSAILVSPKPTAMETKQRASWFPRARQCLSIASFSSRRARREQRGLLGRTIKP
mmetsp:Transcript_11484/g.26145  ORF Transcript_11484/g.26145 Transcript_11484/m.26145 type:complete len:162 (+) Transcript_11484:71-556(+)